MSVNFISNVESSSLLLINLTAAAVRGGVIGCRLEPEEKFSLLHERHVTERTGREEEREPESLVSAEFNESWPKLDETTFACGDAS